MRSLTLSLVAFTLAACARTAVPPTPTPESLPLSTRAMRGPFPDLDSWCVALERMHPTDTPRCSTSDAFPPGLDKKATGTAPWREARLAGTEGLDGFCNLAVRTDAGWFVLEQAVGCFSERAKANITVTLGELGFRDVFPGGAPELVLGYTVDTDENEDAQESPDTVHESWHHEALIVCGVGPSGAPRCLPAVPTAGTHKAGDQVTSATVALTPAADSLTVTLNGTADAFVVEDTLAALLGTHRVSFP
jgi:hypothetical protein